MSHLLYVTPRHLFDTKMSIGRRLYVEAVGKKIPVRITGPGSPDWPDSNDITAYLDKQRVYGEPDPLAVIGYKTEEVQGLDRLFGIPRACIFNEANDRQKTRADIEATQATDVFFHHAGDYAFWLNELSREGRKCHLIHHCSAANPFARSQKFEDRPIKIGLSGVLSREIYPIRDAFARSGICEVRTHPGYRIPDVEGQYRDYQEWLASVQVLVCCTSRYRYPLAKIHEGLAAGCIVVSDRPNCVFLDNVPYVGWIDSEMASRIIESPVYAAGLQNYLLAMAGFGQEASDRSLQVWQDRFTLEHWADNFLGLLFGITGNGNNG